MHETFRVCTCHLLPTRSFDIAMVRMEERMKFGPSVAPICLPSKSSPELFEKVYVAG